MDAATTEEEEEKDDNKRTCWTSSGVGHSGKKFLAAMATATEGRESLTHKRERGRKKRLDIKKYLLKGAQGGRRKLDQRGLLFLPSSADGLQDEIFMAQGEFFAATTSAVRICHHITRRNSEVVDLPKECSLLPLCCGGGGGGKEEEEGGSLFKIKGCLGGGGGGRR